MPRIFISYRRADTEIISGRIYDRLASEFGYKNIFKDVYNIAPGADFRVALQQAIHRCDIVMVVIGPQWVNIAENGVRRLDNPGDFVRVEVETALASRKISVIPLLVQGARMPDVRELPPSLQGLAYRNGVQIRNDPDFHRDMNQLLHQIPGYKPRTASPQRSSIGIFSSLMGIGVIGVVFLICLAAAAYGITQLPEWLATDIPPTQVVNNNQSNNNSQSQSQQNPPTTDISQSQSQSQTQWITHTAFNPVVGSFNFEHPADWIIDDQSTTAGSVLMGNTQTALDLLLSTAQMPSGLTGAIIAPVQAGVTANSAYDALNAVLITQASLEQTTSHSAIYSFPLGNTTVWRADLSTGQGEGFYLCLDFGTTYVIFGAVTALGELPNHEPTLLDIAASIR